MERKEVSSSLIRSLGYDSALQVLEVQFHPNKQQATAGLSGPVYQYTPIPEDLYQEMMNSGSIGSFFITRIKKNPDIQFTRIEETQNEKEENQASGSQAPASENDDAT